MEFEGVFLGELVEGTELDDDEDKLDDDAAENGKLEKVWLESALPDINAPSRFG